VRDSDKQTQRGGDAASAYSLGFELVCAVAGFVLVGVWIDRHYSSGPWGTLICLVLGLIGGFYNLFRGMSRLAGGLGPGQPRGASRAPGNKGEAPRAPATAPDRGAALRAPEPHPDTPAGSDGSDGDGADSRDATRSAGATGVTGAVE
jgi:F0F1-type ATP synthase assembly protein I